jgi:uncharacterized protein YggL (DUF469 family)
MRPWHPDDFDDVLDDVIAQVIAADGLAFQGGSTTRSEGLP